MKLYLIASGDFEREDFLRRVREALEGGVDWVQIRIKDRRESLEVGKQVLALKRDFPFKLIINDFPEVAAELGADGIHLGEDDPPVKEVREWFRGIIGASCYDDLQRALEAQEAGADYVAFGSLFPTRTKERYRRVAPEVIVEARKRLRIPICVIGGIGRENFHRVLALEPDIIAISSAIFQASSPRREASFFKGKMLYYLSSKPFKGGKMKESELSETLLREDSEFRELYEKHREYEEVLEKLLSKRPLSPEEEVEIKKIKKLKLKIKDRMQEILVREREKRVG